MNALQKKGPFMGAVFSNLIFQGLIAYQSAKTVIENPEYKNLDPYIFHKVFAKLNTGS